MLCKGFSTAAVPVRLADFRSARLSWHTNGTHSMPLMSYGLAPAGRTPELSRCTAIPVPLLVVDRGQHVDGGVPTLAVVDGLDPVNGRRPCASPSRPGPRLDELELVGREERLGERVVPAHASLSHRLLHAVRFAERAELGRAVLTPSVRVEDHPVDGATASRNGHLEGLAHELGSHVGGDRKAQHAAREDVE